MFKPGEEGAARGLCHRRKLQPNQRPSLLVFDSAKQLVTSGVKLRDGGPWTWLLVFSDAAVHRSLWKEIRCHKIELEDDLRRAEASRPLKLAPAAGWWLHASRTMPVTLEGTT